MSEALRPSMLRRRKPNQHLRVTNVELFFDLVFVFAVTQISHALLKDLSAQGLVQTTVLFLAVWWAWIFTAWVTNWLDPDQPPVRLLLFVLMFCGLMLSASLPDAFGARGLLFAVAFAAIQAGRSAVTLWLLPPEEAGMRMNFVRILIWLSCSGAVWVAGGFAGDNTRLALWVIALAIEYCGPVVRFWVPRLGASSIDDWNVEGGHIAERCAGFIIIALGESVLVTGATFSELSWTADNAVAFLAAFIGSIAMWWIYFHKGAEAGAVRISRAADPGRIARLAYTYFHMPVVAGIIVAAVANELVLVHPDGPVSVALIMTATGGPLLFLFGTLLFKWAVRDQLQLSHLVGSAALLVLAAAARGASPLVVAVLATLTLVVVAIWEAMSLRGGEVADQQEVRAEANSNH